MTRDQQRLAAAVSAVLVLCGAAALLVGSRPSRGDLDRSLPVEGEMRSVAIEALPMVASASGRAATEADGDEHTHGDSTTEESFPVHVRVFAGETALPVVGARVTLKSFVRGGGPATAQATTDAAGGAVLLLSPSAWDLGDAIHVSVVDAADEKIFEATVSLVAEMSLQTGEELVLRGRVVYEGPPGEPLGSVVAYALDAANRPTVHFGRGRLVDGEFSIRGHADTRTARYRLVFAIGSTTVWWADATVPELTLGEGVVVPITLSGFECKVSGPNGEPLEGASVCLLSKALPGGIRMTLLTDEHGAARGAAPDAPMELCVGKERYASCYRSYPELQGSVELRLSRLGDNDAVSGVVTDEDGAPVGRAFVSGSPDIGDLELSMAGLTTTYADESGAFVLSAGGDCAYRVQAFKRPFGFTQSVSVRPGARVDLELEKRSAVRITVNTVAEPSAYRSGPCMYYLASLEYVNSYSGHAYGMPFEVEAIRPGIYNLYTFLPGQEVFGESAVLVEAGKTVEVTLDAGPINWVAGRIVNQGGAPAGDAAVRLRRADWPPELLDAWAIDRTDEQGRFSVMGGRDRECELEVFVAGKSVASFSVGSGDNGTLRLP